MALDPPPPPTLLPDTIPPNLPRNVDTKETCMRSIGRLQFGGYVVFNLYSKVLQCNFNLNARSAQVPPSLSVRTSSLPSDSPQPSPPKLTLGVESYPDLVLLLTQDLMIR